MRDIWPSAPVTVSDCVKCTIKRFFEISDSTDTTSGELFANELFTKDGIFKTHKKLIFQGREGTFRSLCLSAARVVVLRPLATRSLYVYMC